MSQLYIGIDPGLTGAVAVIDEQGMVVGLHDTPSIVVKKGKGKRTLHIESAMADIFRPFLFVDEPHQGSGSIRMVCIENVHAMPKQGVTSMFSMGTGFGLWLGIIAALRLPVERVEPAVWKREMGFVSGADKGASILTASRLFPGVSFRKERGRVDTLHGRADSLLLAEHCRRRFTK